MKNFRLPRGCRMALALVLLQAVVALAPRLANAQASIPFKATVAITETILGGTAGCYLQGDISGTGQATQLGKVSIASRDCINPISETMFSFYSIDCLVITTASGEQIFANYSGILSAGLITGSYQVVGGTGRYAHATGAGTVNGQEDMQTGIGQVQLFGTVAF